MHRKELLALKTFPAYFTQDPNQTQSQSLRDISGYWVSFQAMSRVGWLRKDGILFQEALWGLSGASPQLCPSSAPLNGLWVVRLRSQQLMLQGPLHSLICAPEGETQTATDSAVWKDWLAQGNESFQ